MAIAAKIGITGQGTKADRVTASAGNGWQHVGVARLPIGAYVIEQAVLMRIRGDLGILPYLTPNEYETAPKNDLPKVACARHQPCPPNRGRPTPPGAADG
jgi:hypothetical protein